MMHRTLAFLGILAAGTALLFVVGDGAEAQTPMQTISSTGPLDRIWLGNELGCQVRHVLDGPYQWFPPSSTPGDCGWFLWDGSTLYAPNFNLHPGAAGGIGAYTAWAPVSQSGVTGTGTATNPYTVVTTVDGGAANVRAVAQDEYVVGREYYTSWVNITNNAALPKTYVLYRAGDCYLGGSDSGYGAVGISAPGSIACTINPNNVPAGRFEELVPLTPGSAYYHDGYNVVWTWIGGHTAFPNTCQCTVLLDNGAGLSWQFVLQPGQSRSFGAITSFALDPDPTAEFTWATGPCGDLTVDFTDWSTAGTSGVLVQSEWDWGDGSPLQTVAPWVGNVSHTFPGPGTYLVRLTVTNAAGRTDDYTRAVTLPSCPNPPVADFDCVAPALPFRRIMFTDRSSASFGPIVAWDWSFGDGGNSTNQNPSHDYPSGGVWNVTLNVTSSSGDQDEVTKPCIAIANDPPVIDPIPDQVVYETETVMFIVTARDPDGDPLTFTWEPGPVEGLGPRFDAGGRQLFWWTTQKGMVGTYDPVTFHVTDGYSTVSTTARIHVLRLPETPPPAQHDADGDGVPDRHDSCPSVPNPEQGSCTGRVEGIADPPVPVPAPEDAAGGPGGPGAQSPQVPGAADADRDGVADARDNCRLVPNPEQSDMDRDGVGDVCDPDRDGDQVPQADGAGRMWDNCPYTFNPDQRDALRDGVGDACREDRDADTVPDLLDNCPWTANPDQADANGDGAGDACTDPPLPPRIDPDDPGATDGAGGTQGVAAGASAPSVWVWGAGALMAVAALGVVGAVLARRGRKAE